MPALHDDHRHNDFQPSSKGYDLGMLGVLIHVVGDAARHHLGSGYLAYYVPSSLLRKPCYQHGYCHSYFNNIASARFVSPHTSEVAKTD